MSTPLIERPEEELAAAIAEEEGREKEVAAEAVAETIPSERLERLGRSTQDICIADWVASARLRSARP